MVITLKDPTQIPNPADNPDYATGVAVQNLDDNYTMLLSQDLNFNPQYTYTLDPGQWYEFTGDQTFWALFNPTQYNMQGEVIPEDELPGYLYAWINPGGAANNGAQTINGAAAVNILAQPISVCVVTCPTNINAAVPKQSLLRGHAFSQLLPQAGKVTLFHASLVVKDNDKLRFPYFQYNVAGNLFKVPMSMLGLGEGTWEFQGIPGSFSPFQRYEDPLIVFPLPDVSLPSETIISLPTTNFTLDDKWQDIWTQSER